MLGAGRKIFISYRRQDTAAGGLAHGIVQYLSREFGSRNVFIDVDMRAGTKFPETLEKRLAKCKVLLALIGPGWLNAQDEQGRRRLDAPNDWVRLEIARALKRKITAIPVRVGGTGLPKRADLPEEICGLVDHHAAVVGTEGFRNEMAGLARDIRAIPNRLPSRRAWLIAGGAAGVATVVGLVWVLRPIPEPLPVPQPVPTSQALATNVPLSLDRERALKPKDTFSECTNCPEMVVVPAGSFTMGSPSGEKLRREHEGPQHLVTFERPFAVGKFTVTFEEWDACVADRGCSDKPWDAGWGGGRRPVIFVSWHEAKSYVAWLSKKTGKPYRLLTDAEYEYATRAFGARLTALKRIMAGSLLNGRPRPVDGRCPKLKASWSKIPLDLPRHCDLRHSGVQKAFASACRAWHVQGELREGSIIPLMRTPPAESAAPPVDRTAVPQHHGHLQQGRAAVANPEHVEILKKGVAEWNAWREANPTIRPALGSANLSDATLHDATLHDATLHDADLSRANLSCANLFGANLSGAHLTYANLNGADLTNAILSVAQLSRASLIDANLSRANLRRADLIDANLRGADLSGASLINANLSRANLSGADLRDADLSGADLMDAILSVADLSRANLTEANLYKTVFGDVDLTSVIGLETCEHFGPSTIDHRTLQNSGPLPLKFLRGVGLPDNFIDYLPSLLNQAIQHYSCFISYSTQDQEFADRLYADLQNKGVRCWFAPHDLRIGKKILDAIEAAIRLRDRVLLILSEHSINSDWVEDEVTAGFEEERKRGEEVLFPIRLDDTVMKTKEAWAAKLRARLIGDFQHWKDHDAYKRSFERVVRDLTKAP